ncbi:hypothetical protein O181_099603 [Austropuccinia psidii MF-1]|uniref:Reverse transcriptase Ty1/copia-type domain-containing protein n=1 Tax=Austropuccinia psidii MF-1 TaxID=1389203 RepID=A0A9Q3JD07_9BASI|nr:hypothetical protein [Austropuccinia psidii MF-1]
MATFLRTKHIIRSSDNKEFEVIDIEGNQVVSRSYSSGNLILHKYHQKAFATTTISNSLIMLHKASGHPSHEYFKKIYPTKQIPYFDCITCSTCKMTKTTFKGTFPEATHKLQYLHMDLSEEPIDLQLLSLQNQNPQVTDHDIPVQKGYSLILEHTINTSKEIIGNVGDLKNILNHSRRPKHHESLANHLSLDPKTYFQALNSPEWEEWLKAINLELKNMPNHQAWSPTIKLDHIKPLSTTWVFKRKTNENRNLSKFKAHLCVRGFHQKEGVDYTKVFSLTGRIYSLRLLLTLCHINHFPIEQMDVCCAFLNGKPKEVLHILRPSGYTEHPETDVFVLNKSLYGLKKSPRFLHKLLKRTLITIGLSPCNTDPCFYYSQNRNQPLWLFVHIDDIIFGGTWNSLFKEKIQLFFEMEDLGKIKYALGIRITQLGESITLIQDKFIKQILVEFSIEQAKDPPSPLPSNYKELKTLTPEPPKQPPFNF